MTDSDKKSIGRIALRQRAVRAPSGTPAAPEPKEGAHELRALSKQFGVPAIDLDQICLRLKDLDILPREIARQHVILPVLVRDDRLFVAMSNPQDQKVIDELEFVTDKKVYPYVSTQEALELAIEEAYRLKNRGEEYFVGPECPHETRVKAGLEPASHEQRIDEPATDEEPSRPGGLVDEPMPRSEAPEFTDDDFGELSKELSVVTDLPDQEFPSAPADARTILVVDDEADILEMLERLLRSRGYRVVVASNGRAALQMVKEHSPDLIVLDAMLPEVHGFEIARRIKGSKRYGHIPIVMVSAVYRGWRYAEDLRESCGVESYIEKPFKITDVMAAVETALASEEEPTSSQAREVSEEAERALNAGVAAYQAGRLDEAIRHLEAGVAIDPLAYRLHFHLGLLYGKKGRVYEAIGELERAVEINSRHYPAAKNLAILYQKAGFRNKATEMWERALNVAPDDSTRRSIKEHLLSLL